MSGRNISIAVVLLLVLFVIASISSKASADTGTATFYTPPYQPSACHGYTDDGVMIAAASESIWYGGAACGTVYQVQCTSGTNAGVAQPCKPGTSVRVTIVDHCPSPACQATIDLSQEAFEMIADPNEGKINISYDQYVELALWFHY